MPKLYSVRFEIGETLAEYNVALAALTRFQAGVQGAQPGFWLPERTQPHHLDQAIEKLEGTYLIRMWTEKTTEKTEKTGIAWPPARVELGSTHRDVDF